MAVAKHDDVRGPLQDHPQRGEIEDLLRGRSPSSSGLSHLGSNDQIAAHFDISPELVRQHRLFLFPADPIIEARRAHKEKHPDGESLARAVSPPVVAMLDGVLEAADVYVSAKIQQVGPLSRWVGVGDLITTEEAGNGVSHGTAYKLPAARGVIGLLRALFARVHALESLIASGDPELLSAERDIIIKRLRLRSDDELVAEAKRRGYEVEKA